MDTVNMLLSLLLVCLIFDVTEQSCVGIDQTGEGIIHEAIDLNCVLQGNAAGVTAGIVTWSYTSPSSGKQVDIAEANIHDDSASVFPGYEDKVDSSWDAGSETFTLTIKSLSLEDDAEKTKWQCELASPASCGGGMGKEEHFITVKVPPTDDSVSMNGLTNDWVNRDTRYDLTCTVDPIKPRASVYWSIDGETQEETDNVPTEHDDGTYRLVGTLTQFQFPKTTSKVAVSCLVTEENQPASVIFTKHYRDVEVWWKASTEVKNVTSYAPREGEEYNLQCDVISANPPPTAYRWQGETSTQQTLHIPSLDKTQHSKTFTCAADNDAGAGDFGTGLPVQVWYVPVVETSVAGPAVEESSVTLECHMQEGFPEQLLQVQWEKDEEALDREVEGGDVRNPSIVLMNVEKNDAGDYVCALTNEAGTARSDKLTLEVYYKPEGKSSLSISTGERKNIAVGEEVTFTCTHQHDSNPQPNHFTFYKDREEQFNDSVATWTPAQSSSVHDGGVITCVASNIVAAAQNSDPMEITVEAPAMMEEFTHSKEERPVYDADFSLDCVGSGNERTVTWTKDGQALSPLDYEEKGSGVEEDGPYSYGQREAYRRKYEWKAPGKEEEAASCSSVARHNGSYMCEVKATAGAADTRNTSSLTLNVQYPPISSTGSDFQKTAAAAGDDVTFLCDVCSYPEVRSYEWSFNGTSVGSGSSLSLSDIGEDDYGNYTCTVANEINGETQSTLLVFFLQARGGPGAVSNMNTIEPTSQTVNVTFTPGFNGGMTQTFNLQYKLSTQSDDKYIEYASGIEDPNPTEPFSGSLQRQDVNERVEGLEGEETYTFRVQAENNFEDDDKRFSEWTDIDGNTTVTPKVKLLHLEYRYKSDSVPAHIEISWEVEKGEPDSLTLRYSPSSGKSGAMASEETVMVSEEKVMVAGLDPAAASYANATEEELEAGVQYVCRLYAVEGSGVSTAPGTDGERTIGGSDGLGAGGIVGIVLALAVVVGLVGVGLFSYRRKQKVKETDRHMLGSSNDISRNGLGDYDDDGVAAGYATVGNGTQMGAVPKQQAPARPVDPPAAVAGTSGGAGGAGGASGGAGPVYAIVDMKAKPTKPPKPQAPPADDSYDDEDPYASAPPIPDHYVPGDFYAMCGPPDKVLYNNVNAPKKEGTYVTCMPDMTPRNVVPSRFKLDTVYDTIDFSKQVKEDTDSD